MVGSDTDQAIYEWGSYVDGRINRETRRYTEEIERRNSQSAREAAKSGMTPSFEKADPARLQELYAEQVAYWVDGWVVMNIDLMGDGLDEDGLPEDGGKAQLRKRAVYDPAIDFDFDTEDTEEVYFD